VLPVLAAGAALAVRDAFIPRRALADLTDPATRVFLGVPSMYRFLLEAKPAQPPRLDHIRCLLSCTAPLSPDLIRRFLDGYHAPICQHYGSSEAGAVTTHVPAEVATRPESVGLAMHGVRVTIQSDDGRDLPAGAEGEVVVQSAAVAAGYVMGQPDGESPFLREDGFRMGDLGMLDTGGYLSVRGRKDNLISVGGLKVSPLEVTQVLESHDAVREAAVVGRKDATGEEVVHAFVCLKRSVTENEVREFCQQRLADYKVPRRIEFLPELPRGATGKVDLRTLGRSP
jgi:long-chain acyl-CoA synthetase